MKNTKGFTLIELLVVIAIIGILSSVVLASLSTARAKSRDAKRISDLGQIQLALELYYDSSSSYPVVSTHSTTSATYTLLSGHLAPTYIAKVPTDPRSQPFYYGYGGTSTAYILTAILEKDDNSALLSDADYTVGSPAISWGGGLNSSSTNCTGGAGKDACYDITN